MRRSIRGALIGGAIGTSVANVHAIGWWVFFALGPTPRDFASSYAFAAGMFLLLEAAGLILMLPTGIALGAAVTRGQGRRASVVLAVAPILLSGCIAASWLGSRFWIVLLPTLAIAAAIRALVSKLVNRA